MDDRHARPPAVTVDGQGIAWFTERGRDRVGMITPDGSVTVYDLSTPRSEQHGSAVGPDGALWTALEIGALARIAQPDSTA
ncbi:hypothetical protein ACGFXB_33145 [Streptomyces canus]|uniref:virginiamycin B lyase family protein n=1 Tax=Streptomyces canus TaxID=58343 RepID=UPI003710EA47